jgi:hypothetical protein
LGEAHVDETTIALIKDQVKASFGKVPYATLEAERDPKELAIVHALAELMDTPARQVKGLCCKK